RDIRLRACRLSAAVRSSGLVHGTRVAPISRRKAAFPKAGSRRGIVFQLRDASRPQTKEAAMHRRSRGQGAAAAVLFGLAVTALGGFTACDRTSGADADNTARNARDSNGKTVTPTDQSENEGDLAITQRVRKNIVDNDAL